MALNHFFLNNRIRSECSCLGILIMIWNVLCSLNFGIGFGVMKVWSSLKWSQMISNGWKLTMDDLGFRYMAGWDSRNPCISYFTWFMSLFTVICTSTLHIVKKERKKPTGNYKHLCYAFGLDKCKNYIHIYSVPTNFPYSPKIQCIQNSQICYFLSLVFYVELAILFIQLLVSFLSIFQIFHQSSCSLTSSILSAYQILTPFLINWLTLLDLSDFTFEVEKKVLNVSSPEWSFNFPASIECIYFHSITLFLRCT